MIRILKDENAKLKESILAISTAAYRSQRELKDAITEACRIAELNPSGSTRDGSSPQHMDDDLEHGSVVEHSPRPSSAQPLSSSYPQLSGHHHHHGSSSSSAWPASSLEMRSPHPDTTTQPGLGGGSIYSFDPAHTHGYINNSHAGMFAAAAAAQPMTHMNAMPIHELRPAHSSSFNSIYSQGGYADPIPRGKNPEMMQYESSMQTYMPSRSSPTRREHGSTSSSAAAFPTQPPDDIIPYLGPRAYTIAGQVYWATLGYAWQVLRSLDTTYPAPSSDTLAAIYNLFHIDASSPQTIAVIKDHLYLRLSFRKQRASSIPPTQQLHHNHAQPQLQPPPGPPRDRSIGSSSSASTLFDATGGGISSASSSITPPTPQHHSSSAGMMSFESLVGSSTTMAGLDPNTYISALAVEEQMRHMLGHSNAQDLETALRNGALTNGGGGSATSTGTGTTPTPPQQYSRASISGSVTVPSGGNPAAAPSTGANAPGVVPAKQLLHTMARQAVFFADGPRWHPESVASAASMWSMEWQ